MHFLNENWPDCLIASNHTWACQNCKWIIKWILNHLLNGKEILEYSKKKKFKIQIFSNRPKFPMLLLVSCSCVLTSRSSDLKVAKSQYIFSISFHLKKRTLRSVFAFFADIFSGILRRQKSKYVLTFWYFAAFNFNWYLGPGPQSDVNKLAEMLGLAIPAVWHLTQDFEKCLQITMVEIY